MAELTPSGFRTAAYLEAKARLDKRQGKTRNKVVCNPPNKQCGNRCIPPNWDCRFKGEGSDPQLKAVKTDPLGGIASIERGTKRIVRGISRGSFADVEGGKKSIIRGAVKIAPGNIEQKKQLKTTLENRTRAIGIGLAVITGGLSVHAILMKGNTFGYRDGLGRDINNAVRSGVNNVLDAVPILGTQRRAVRSQASTDVTRAAIRLGRTQTSGPVALSEQLDIPTTNALGQVRGTTIAQRNIENAGKLTRTINEVNTSARERNTNIYSWNEAHRQAFWNVKTKEQDISNKEINIFAKPAAEEFLRSQYDIPPSADTSSALKSALQEQIRAERDNYVSLARQQGFRIQRRDSRDIIHPDDNTRFVRNLVRSTAGTGVMSREARNSIEDHVQSVLGQAPSTYTNKLYRETVLGFDSFYNKVGSTSRSVAGVSSGATEVDPRRTFNFDPQRIPTIPRRERDILEAADEMRSRFMLNQMRGTGNGALSIAGTGHAELTRIAYFSTRVNGTNNSTYSGTERVAKAAASELAGRPVTSTTEAFTLLRTQYGFTGATEVRPATGPGATAPRGRETRGQRSQRNLTELARSIMARPGNENMDLAAALRQARSEQRGDSPEYDLPPRIRAFLEHRADLKEAPRLGKPCGASHIPKAHECRKGERAGSTQSAVASAALVAGATATAVALTSNPKLRQRVAVETRLILRGSDKAARQALILGGRGTVAGLSLKQVKEGLNKLPEPLQGPARKLVGGAKQGAAAMALRAEGFSIQDIDVVNNFSTWKNKKGTLISVGSYGDSLVTYVSDNSHSWKGQRVYKVGFNVDQNFDATRSIPADQARDITAAVRKMTDNQLNKINNGILATFPWDGDEYGAKRRAIYSRAGFNNIIGEESQWALVQKGRIKKMSAAESFIFLAESGERDAPIYKPSRKERKDALTKAHGPS